MKAAAARLDRPQAAIKAADGAQMQIASGTLEALKWLALALMTLDHINKYFYSDKIASLFALGRMAMPLFAFVLAYNLARPGALDNSAALRVIKRLVLFGAVASVPYIALGGVLDHWWPLNILFTLAAGVLTIFLASKGGTSAIAAALVFIVCGAVVEFWWFALAFMLSAWWYVKRPCLLRAALLIAITASLYVVNRNLWAMAALPLIAASPYASLTIRRYRNLFYIYYPAHLAAILLITTLIPTA